MSDPAEKYRDRVDLKHKMAMDAIGFSRQLLAPHLEQLELLIEAERRSHSIGHILDPTLYRDQINSKSFEQQMRIARAAVAYIKVLNEVAEELETTAPIQGRER